MRMLVIDGRTAAVSYLHRDDEARQQTQLKRINKRSKWA